MDTHSFPPPFLPSFLCFFFPFFHSSIPFLFPCHFPHLTKLFLVHVIFFCQYNEITIPFYNLYNEIVILFLSFWTTWQNHDSIVLQNSFEKTKSLLFTNLSFRLLFVVHGIMCVCCVCVINFSEDLPKRDYPKKKKQPKEILIFIHHNYPSTYHILSRL